MTTHSPTHVSPPVSMRTVLTRLATAAGTLALFCAVMWFAWLGWDREHHVVDGATQGPYRPWQVVGCSAAIVVAAIVAHLWARTSWALLVLPAAAVVGFALPWTLDAARSDDSGLFVVGLLLLVIGGGIGLTVVLGCTAALAALWDSVRRPSTRSASGHGAPRPPH